MRANEAQVAELSRKLSQLEMEKARLASRARLLEQVGIECLQGLCTLRCLHHAVNLLGPGDIMKVA